MRNRLFILLFFLLPGAWHNKANAGQFAGGELSYKILNHTDSYYTYEFTLKIYRDCKSYADFNRPVLKILNTTHLQSNTHPLWYKEEMFEAPQIISLPYQSKYYCVINDPNDCIDLYLFKLIMDVPYSPEGYTLKFTDCCRNGLTNLVTSESNFGIEMVLGIPESGQSLTYFNTIPSHDSTEINSSPVSSFDSIPYATIGNPFLYQFQYSDIDGDSLAYKPAYAVEKQNNATSVFFNLNYATGYSDKSPVSGNPPFSINPVNGIVTGTPNRPGKFCFPLLVEEYRNGKLINIHRREYQVNVYDASVKKLTDITRCDTSNLIPFVHNNSELNEYAWDFGVPGREDDKTNNIFPLYRYPEKGSYLVKMIVKNKSGCMDSAFCMVKLFKGIKADFNWPTPVCNINTLTLKDASLTDTGQITAWRWRDLVKKTAIGNTGIITYSPSILFNNNQPYPLTINLAVETNLGCKDSVSKVVEIYPEIFADAGPDKILAFDVPYTMPAITRGATIFNWSPATGLSNPFIQTPVLTNNRNTTYTLTAYNTAGCFKQDAVTIKYMKGPDIYVPGVFTPNNDGLNDKLRLYPVALTVESFSVYNRWGQLVYQSNDFNEGWDGTVKGGKQIPGVYSWVATAKDNSGKIIIKKGIVTLLQ